MLLRRAAYLLPAAQDDCDGRPAVLVLRDFELNAGAGRYGHPLGHVPRRIPRHGDGPIPGEIQDEAGLIVGPCDGVGGREAQEQDERGVSRPAARGTRWGWVGMADRVSGP